MTQYKLSFIKKTQVVATKPIFKKKAPSPTIKIVKYDKKNYITNLPSISSYYLIYFYDSSNTLVDISNDLSNVKVSFLENINSGIPDSKADFQYSDNELINTSSYYWYWNPVLKALIYTADTSNYTRSYITYNFEMFKFLNSKCFFSETSIIKNFKQMFNPITHYIKYNDYKKASLSIPGIGISFPSIGIPLKSLTFMTSLNKIEIVDGYKLIKNTTSEQNYLGITFKFKDKDNKIITLSNSNLSMFRYETTSYINKKLILMYSDTYNFKDLNLIKSRPLSYINEYCINNDNSLSMFADISVEGIFDVSLTRHKCYGVISYIQFSLGHIFAPTIKIDYLNDSKITII